MNHNQSNTNKDEPNPDSDSGSTPQEVPPTKEVPEQQPLTKAGSDSDAPGNSPDTPEPGSAAT